MEFVENKSKWGLSDLNMQQSSVSQVAVWYLPIGLL